MNQGRELILDLSHHFKERSKQYESDSDKYKQLCEQSECMKRFIDDFDINQRKAMAWDEVIQLLNSIIEKEKEDDTSENIIVYRAVKGMMERII